MAWAASLHAGRLKLVVQNRRFTILAPRGARPNLASRALGLWLGAFGYEPLVAETFCDVEASAGTCYRAAGWTPLGVTAGYSRHAGNFYVPGGRPKALWVKELCPGARATLLSLVALAVPWAGPRP